MGDSGEQGHDFDATLRGLAEEVRAMRAELDQLRTENRDLRERVDRPAPPPASAPPVEGSPSAMGRRRLLRDGLIAGAAATTAVVASAAQPSAAADGNNLVIGNLNSGSAYTVLTGSSLLALSSSGAFPSSGDLPAFAGAADGSGTVPVTIGVVGWATGTATTGVFARGPIGAEVRSNLTHLRLGAISGTRQAPVFDPVAHVAGDVVRTAAGELWWCTTDGTPGQWVKLGGPTTAGSLHLLPAPVRVYDSRPGTTPSQGPKTPLPAGNVARTIDMSANNSGVPKNLTASGGRYAATGVMLNVLLVNAASGAGNFTVWAADQPKPQSNTLVWGGTAGRYSTLAVTAVDTNASIKVDASLQTNLVIDVVGYYR